MLDCLIIGDEIAKGIANTLPDCKAITAQKMKTQDFISKYRTKLGKNTTVIISLGMADSKDPHVYQNLSLLRSSVEADVVVWMIPNETLFPELASYIEALAQDFGDGTIGIRKDWLEKDGIHPTKKGYKELGKSIKEVVY